MNRRAGLATLAARLSDVYPDIGPAAAQAWVVAAVDALVHALVDLADGRNHFTQHTEVRALPLLERQHTRAPDPQVDRASCAAAAAEVRQVQHAARPLLSEPGDRMTGAADRAARALELLAGALEDLAAVPPADARASVTRAGAMRGIRSAYRVLQPERDGAQPMCG